MSKQTFKELPADGGSYRQTKSGYERLDEPQQPDPGKTARLQDAGKAVAEPAQKATTSASGAAKKE